MIVPVEPPAQVGEAILGEKLGEGGRSTAFAADYHGRPVAVKIYKPIAINRHAMRHPQNIAEYEFQRNRFLYNVPGLRDYIAEPIDFVVDDQISAIIQEQLTGPLYYFYYRDRSGKIDPAFREHLKKIIDLAHQAEFYDVDLHAFNVIVDESTGEPKPKLFDFNLIPFYDKPGHWISKLGLKLGVIHKRDRDLRLLRNFDKVARQERKLVKYFESSKA